MDKEHVLPSDADSYEFINEGDARSIRSDSSDVNSTDSGVPLSAVESALAKHVRHLKQENKEIRSAIDNYQEALQLCQDNLNNLIAQQGEIQSDTLQKYNQAKIKVERQNEKISSLEKQLQEEKNKHSELTGATKIQADKQQSEKNDCEKVDGSDKDDFEEKVSSLHQFITSISALTLDARKASISPGLLQDLINLSVDMEKSLKPFAKSGNTAPERKNDIAAENELKFLKEQLKQEVQKRAELEIKINELQAPVEGKRKDGVDVNEVEKELKLLDRDMDKMDMLRAGCVSNDTIESLSLDQQGKQMPQSVDNSLSSQFEKEKQELKKQIDNLQRVHSRRESAYLTEKENMLLENEALQKELSRCRQDIEELKAKLDEKADASQLADAVAANSKIQEELLQQQDQNETIEKQLHEVEKQLREAEQKLREVGSVNDELEKKLGQNDLHHRQELKMKENVENELKAQGYSFYQDLQTKEMECEDLRARLELSETEWNKMKSALTETRKELAAVYSENEEKGATGAELGECQSKIDNLTAQLLSAEEMLEHKEQDLRKMQVHHESLASELETVPLLKQQLDFYKADFNTEQQTRQKVEDDNRKLRDEVTKLQAQNERLVEEANDPTGSKMADMQRRHGCGANVQPPGNDNNAWSGFYDKFLAPRGLPPGGRINPHPPAHDNDINRQVSGGRCPKCDRMFPDLDTLQTHVVECLESTGSVGGKICPKCQESFPDLDTLQIHVMECLDN